VESVQQIRYQIYSETHCTIAGVEDFRPARPTNCLLECTLAIIFVIPNFEGMREEESVDHCQVIDGTSAALSSGRILHGERPRAKECKELIVPMAMAVCRSIGFHRRRRFMIVESGQGTLEGVIDTVVNKCYSPTEYRTT
jgi:hypothetical protein